VPLGESGEAGISGQQRPLLDSRPMGLRILIVDDSETTRRILRAIVHSREWTVCGEAENGRAGIAKFDELKPDLVLVDLAMPDMNGLEAAQNMAAIDSSIPLVLFTVLDMPAIAAHARSVGISEVVSKAQAWDLVRTIERVVAKRLAQGPVQ
jgi:DNA-binding NarL/FixJ family response regulator